MLRDVGSFLDLGAGSSLWHAWFILFGEYDFAGLVSAPGAAFITPLILFVCARPDGSRTVARRRLRAACLAPKF